MNAFRIAAVIVAPLLISGWYSTPKEKTEYEKQIDAVPMPVTEAERVEQRRYFQRSADLQRAEDAWHTVQRPKLGASNYECTESLALLRRLRVMKCPGYGWFSR